MAQCEVARKYAADINFIEVHISPLRRTMETAWRIFKGHPNFKEIKFIVNPLLIERIMIGSDIPSYDSYEVIKNKYLPLWENNGGNLEFDDSLKADKKRPWRPWWFYKMNEEFKLRILENIREGYDGSKEEVMEEF